MPRATLGLLDLHVGDLAMRRFMVGNQQRKSLQATIKLELEPHRVADPRAQRWGVPASGRSFGSREQLGVDGCAEPLLAAHTLSVR